MSDITNNEIAGILRSGAERLCDYALEQWMGHKYGDDAAMINENVRRWGEIRRKLPTKKQLEAMLDNKETQNNAS